MSKQNGIFNHADGVTLKEYMDTKISALDRATSVASEAMNKRLESMNEFRAQLKDQNATFLTRNEYEAKHALLESKIESLQRIVYLATGAVLIIDYFIKFIK